MDMPATLKGEPLYWTGCEWECWKGGRCSWAPPAEVLDWNELLPLWNMRVVNEREKEV